MAASVPKLQLWVQALDFSRTDHRHRIRLKLNQNQARAWRCRAFRSEEGESLSSGSSDGEKEKGSIEVKRKGPLYSVKSLLVRVLGSQVQVQGEYKKAVEKAEEVFFWVTTQVGRYLLTMMSTGVILAVGFQLSGGNSQMNILIWYSWLGGVIIGTMIGANMVLEEHSKAGPRNVVITGSTRGLGKALTREFLLSGDHIVIASRKCPESVDTTVEELKENLKKGIEMAGTEGTRKFSHAKVAGIACDVCNPDDMRKLANFAVNGLGRIDIWIGEESDLCCNDKEDWMVSLNR